MIRNNISGGWRLLGPPDFSWRAHVARIDPSLGGPGTEIPRGAAKLQPTFAAVFLDRRIALSAETCSRNRWKPSRFETFSPRHPRFRFYRQGYGRLATLAYFFHLQAGVCW